MKSNFLRWTSLLIILLPATVKAAVSVDHFINITDKHHVSCQEYYYFKDLIYCSIKSIHPQMNVDPRLLLTHKQNIIFDDRLWKPSFTTRTRFMVSIIYIPEDQDSGNWNEMIASQFVSAPFSTNTIQMFMENVIERLYISGITPTISLLDSAPDQRIYELLLHTPATNTVENELLKITKGPDGFYILRYVNKSADMGAENRKKWLNLLKKSEIRPQVELPPLPIILR